jgi:hypothetical protein
MSSFKVFNIPITDEIRNGQLFWHLGIHKPFYYKDGMRIGINERIIQHAQRAGVYEFIVNGKNIRVPSNKSLKEKKKTGEYEVKASLFGKENDYIIYYFKI